MGGGDSHSEFNPTKEPYQKTLILHHDFSTQKGLVPRYTANIDKMMNSDSIFIKFFKIKKYPTIIKHNYCEFKRTLLRPESMPGKADLQR